MPPRSSFIEPCLPSAADQPPSGPEWIHEIKHDGYRLMAKRDPVGIRLQTRRGNDWSERLRAGRLQRRKKMIEFLTHMPANTVIFITMAVLGLAGTLIVLKRLN
jgi:ATP-dependent DNA ligase